MECDSVWGRLPLYGAVLRVALGAVLGETGGGATHVAAHGATLGASLGAVLVGTLDATFGETLIATLGAALGLALSAALSQGAVLIVALGATRGETLGSTLDAALGKALGAALGAMLVVMTLGATLGEKLRATLDVALGMALSAPLGETLGATLGATLLGEALGAGLGAVGVVVTLGATLGETLGSTLGQQRLEPHVGAALGETLGAGLGAVLVVILGATLGEPLRATLGTALGTVKVKVPFITAKASLFQVLFTVNEFTHAKKTLSLTTSPKIYDKFSDLLRDFANLNWWNEYASANVPNRTVDNFSTTIDAFINYKFDNNTDNLIVESAIPTEPKKHSLAQPIQMQTTNSRATCNHYVILENTMFPELSYSMRVLKIKCFIVTQNIDYHLLIGRRTMRDIGMKMDFEACTIEWYEKTMHFHPRNYFDNKSMLYKVMSAEPHSVAERYSNQAAQQRPITVT
eukprot:jgi/Psemu1/11614/gm1.11614_g